jgi:hypothetical protein
VLLKEHVPAMRQQEQQATVERRPEQAPRDVNEDRFTPWTAGRR